MELVLATLNQVEGHDVKELWAEEAEKRYREHRAGKIEAKRVDNVFEQVKKQIKWAGLYFSVRLSRKCLRP